MLREIFEMLWLAFLFTVIMCAALTVAEMAKGWMFGRHDPDWGDDGVDDDSDEKGV